MKRYLLILTALLAGCAFAFAQTAFDGTFPSKWKLTKSNSTSFEQLWEADRTHIGATECGKAYLDAPSREKLNAGDCWTFHFPVENLQAGSFIEFDLMLGAISNEPKHFELEYLDGRKWKDAGTVKCVGGRNEPATIIKTLRFEKAIKEGEILIRLRSLDGDGTGEFKMMPYGYIAGYAQNRGTQAPKDTLKLGYLGNSFTFVNATDFMLKEIAWCEGHFLDMDVTTYPGASFKNHLGLMGSLDVISKGGYDWVILQDQSQQAALFGRDSSLMILEYTKTISKVIRYFSPKAQLLYEQTWAYSNYDFGGLGGFDYFDKCATKGASDLAKATHSIVSPIAQAFAVVRAERPDIEIYSTDFHHPAAYGAYLKACVNYLMIFGQPFSGKGADFALDPATCEYLRSVAQRICLQ